MKIILRFLLQTCNIRDLTQSVPSFPGFSTHPSRPSVPFSSTLPTSSCPRSPKRTHAPCELLISRDEVEVLLVGDVSLRMWFPLFTPLRYLMNFLLDATLGMLVIWLAVKLVSRLVEYKQWTLLMFGEYGERKVIPFELVFLLSFQFSSYLKK